MTRISMLILGCLGAAAAIGLAVFTPRESSRPGQRPQLTSAQATELKTPAKPAPPPSAQRPEDGGGDDSPADYFDAEDGPGS
jgi:hypothetical protein